MSSQHQGLAAKSRGERVIVIDTSALIDALTGTEGRRLLLPSLVLFEWLRGPRRPEELEAQEALLPREKAVAFGAEEAALAARLYAKLPRARGREVDLEIAASALTQGAALWTLNSEDFRDIRGLEIYEPAT